MVRKISLSQFKSKIRSIENQQKQAIRRHNQGVRKYNQDVNRVINKYNQEVRVHNTRVRANSAKINAELAKIQRRTTTRYPVYHTSVISLHESFIRLEAHSNVGQIGNHDRLLLDLSERENANSLEVMNALLGDVDVTAIHSVDDLQSTHIITELQKISDDLDNRWKGAIYSLSPKNPDAARHFCTSAREIFGQILDSRAPNEKVLKVIPDCHLTDMGIPTRREKIKYILQNRSATSSVFLEFAEQDIANVLELFRLLNDGTHGSAGKYDLSQLLSIKKRVEDGLIFLCNIAE